MHENNWREAQVEHHLSRARLFACYAAAYESEARTCKQTGRRKYLFTKARQFRKDAELRFAKAKQFSRPAAAWQDLSAALDAAK